MISRIGLAAAVLVLLLVGGPFTTLNLLAVAYGPGAHPAFESATQSPDDDPDWREIGQSSMVGPVVEGSTVAGPSVMVFDAQGHSRDHVRVHWRISGSGTFDDGTSSDLQEATSVTDPSDMAYSPQVHGQMPGPGVIEATLPDFPGAQPYDIPFTVGNGPLTPVVISKVRGDETTTPVGTFFGVTARTATLNGSDAPGSTQFRIVSGPATFFYTPHEHSSHPNDTAQVWTTNSTGTAASGAMVSSAQGTVTIEATGPRGLSTTFTVHVGPPIEATLAAVSGGGESVETGRPFAQPLVSTVIGTDAYFPYTSLGAHPIPGGAIFPGVHVWYSIVGPATFADGSTRADVFTGADGTATSPTLIAGTTAGTVTITAGGPGYFPGPVTWTETVTAPRPARLAATSGSGQSAQTGQSFMQPLTATVTGTNDRPYANAPVTYAVTGPATFANGATSATATTGPDGRAISPVLRAAAAAGTVTVTASTPGVVGTAMWTETVTAAPAPPPPASSDVSVRVAAPATTPAGATFAVTVTVSNAGPSAATGVVGTLFVPTMTATNGGGGAVSVDRHTVTFTQATLAAGQSVTYRVTLTAPSAASTTQTIYTGVSSRTADPFVSNNTIRTNLAVAPA